MLHSLYCFVVSCLSYPMTNRRCLNCLKLLAVEFLYYGSYGIHAFGLVTMQPPKVCPYFGIVGILSSLQLQAARSLLSFFLMK